MDEERKKSPVWAIVVVVLLLPLLYVLSTAPAYWLFQHGYISHETYSLFYRPIALMSRLCPPFSLFIQWLLGLVAK